MGNLIAAYTVAWCLLMGYLLTLGARQRRLRRTLEELERMAPGRAQAASPNHGD